MTQRIARLRHERIHSQIPPSRTVHLISNVAIEAAVPEGKLLARSNFLIAEYRPSVPEGLQRFFAGRYEHSLTRQGDSLRIASKKAVLVNCDSTFASLALYF
jgi:benzoate/toluate 1,2-dioxygenase beta subunit